MQSAKGVTMLPRGQSIQVCLGWRLEARPGAGGRCLGGQCGRPEQSTCSSLAHFSGSVSSADWVV